MIIHTTLPKIDFIFMTRTSKTRFFNFTISLFILFLAGCSTTGVEPVVVTAAVRGISSTSALAGGVVTSEGATVVTGQGVCWSTSASPTLSNSYMADSSGKASFSCSISGLLPSTLYHVRAYAVNSGGTSYGNEVTFTTSPPADPVLPTLSTVAATTISNVTAISGGDISSDGGATVTARGICWSTTTGPTIALTTKTTDGTGAGIFTSTLTGLTALTTYYVRAYATNSVGTEYGDEISFTTIANPTAPVLSTVAASAIGSTTATSGGNITSDGGATVTVRGVCWSTTSGPTTALSTKTSDGTGTGTFASNITGLTAFTTYYVRAYATNSVGTVYGNEINFTTGAGPALPTLTTTAASSIATTTATGGGNITSDGGATVTARGICWSTSSGPTVALSTKVSNGTGTGTFTGSMTGLTAATTYYVRAYATNSAGTAYGNEISFTTAAAPAATAGTLAVTVTTSTYNGSYAPRHVLAIWVATSSGTFVKSLMVYAAARKSYLTNWYSATSTGNTTDATTGATLSSHGTRTCSWNGTNSSRVVVTDGAYKLCVEYTENNSTGKLATFSFTKGTSASSVTGSTVSGVTLSTLTWTP